mmetsp:Transcript_46230/g.119146  ORF Transcript_46230/g.119146 Transcript_46230/m.119146 type:complete len:394 (-) Transcript_46230:47-1228(-)
MSSDMDRRRSRGGGVPSAEDLGFGGDLGQVFSEGRKREEAKKAQLKKEAEEMKKEMQRVNQRDMRRQEHAGAFGGSLDAVLAPPQAAEKRSGGRGGGGESGRQGGREEVQAGRRGERGRGAASSSLEDWGDDQTNELHEVEMERRRRRQHPTVSAEDYTAQRQAVARIRDRNSNVSSDNPLIAGSADGVDERFAGREHLHLHDEDAAQPSLGEVLGGRGGPAARGSRRGGGRGGGEGRSAAALAQARRELPPQHPQHPDSQNEYLSDFLSDENLTYDFLIQLDQRVPRLGLAYAKLRRFKRWTVSKSGKPFEGHAKMLAFAKTSSAGGHGGSAQDEEDEECPVCFEVYGKGDHLKLLPCGHYFHEDCLIKWFKNEVTCPLCRYNCNTNQPASV